MCEIFKDAALLPQTERDHDSSTSRQVSVILSPDPSSVVRVRKCFSYTPEPFLNKNVFLKKEEPRVLKKAIYPS